MADDIGARVSGSKASPQARSGLGPTGYDPARIGRAICILTPAQRRNLLALPWHPEAWATVSEMRHKGATGAGMDILHVYHGRVFSTRRWAKWGAETGQKRGEGYEYAITPFGAAVRDAIAIEARSDATGTGAAEGESAAIAQGDSA